MLALDGIDENVPGELRLGFVLDEDERRVGRAQADADIVGF